MNRSMNEPTVSVRVPVNFVNALLQVQDSLNGDLIELLKASLSPKQKEIGEVTVTQPRVRTSEHRQKYYAEYLGTPVGGNTLPEVFAQLVDLTNELAPEAIEALADMRAHSRRYVAKKPEAIHPGSPGLPVKLTSSGWWISKNIGQDDLKRAMKALCRASGLKFGVDVSFPAQLRGG